MAPLLRLIRRAVAADAATLTRIAFAAKAHWGYPAENLERWRPQLTITPEFIESNPVWVAESSGGTLGFTALVPVGRRARLEHLWVDPPAMRQGIGRALFQKAAEVAAEAGWECLEFDSDPNAEGFYQRMGARRVRLNHESSDPHSRPLQVFEFDLLPATPAPAPTRPDIVLATLNAKFIHAAFGLRYLMANLGELRDRAAIAEFDINQKPVEIAESLLARNPRILGLGVYIWNVTATTELVAILKRARPELIVILGGPEVSYETDGQPVVDLADHVIQGEADLKFAEVCRQLLSPTASPPPRVIDAGLPDLSRVELPYDLYDTRDAAHRVIYVEASRGCPFTCEFCLSSLDIPVRQFPLDRFLAAMSGLLDRGVTQFKFVDRTFNLHLPTSRAILRFFLERWRPGLFVHFEMVPDRLPAELRELIAQFPPGALQFEVGIQTFNPDVEALISRRQNHDRLRDNFRWLRGSSGVHVHADLIAGLPGEDLASFARGFDTLIGLDPQEIQVGILKRLRGTPIVRHDREWGMVYNPHPPYEVLQTRLLDFATLSALRRFARFWDLFGNSGNFVRTRPILLGQGASQSNGANEATSPSPFWSFWAFATWLHDRGVKTSGIALNRQFELAYEYLSGCPGLPPGDLAAALRADYQRPGRRDLPNWLASAGPATPPVDAPSELPARHLPSRQARHLPAPAGNTH